MKRTAGILLMLLLALIVASANASFSATKKKAPVKKPAAKPAPKTNTSTPHVVQGTTQLKGEYADFGTAYTLGKDYPFNITLKSAEYTIEPVRIGDATFVPTAEEKLLVLHMNYHNPRKEEYFVRWDSFGFTVVDPKNQNHDGLRDLGMEKDKQTCSMQLKPAQKTEVYGVMVVPAAGEMPKLIIKSSDELVLRYDLKGKVQGLPTQFADPADKTRATALATIEAQMGTYYPLGEFSMKLNKVEYSDSTTMGEVEADEDGKLLVAHIDIKNVTGAEQYLRWDTFASKIIDVDGVEVADCADMFQKSKDKSLSMQVQSGQEISVRCIFKVPADTEIKSLSTRMNEGRTFVFSLSGVQ